MAGVSVGVGVGVGAGPFADLTFMAFPFVMT